MTAIEAILECSDEQIKKANEITNGTSNGNGGHRFETAVKIEERASFESDSEAASDIKDIGEFSGSNVEDGSTLTDGEDDDDDEDDCSGGSC